MKIGSHVSNSGKLMLEGSINEALSYGANCLMVYLGAPQNTVRKPLSEQNIDRMHLIMDANGISHDNCIVHAPYIVNLCNSSSEKRQFGVDLITKELIGVKYLEARCLVLHPGSSMERDVDVAINDLCEALVKIFDNTKDDKTVIAIETMAGKGKEVGRTFEQVRQILDGVIKLNPNYENRIKVCLDTCHIFDGGYDEVMEQLDKIIGINNISVIHVNDSKNVLGSHKDRHENIGYGNIGFDTLSRICHDERFKDVPKILETPYVDEVAPYKVEIEMIKANVFTNTLK